MKRLMMIVIILGTTILGSCTPEEEPLELYGGVITNSSNDTFDTFLIIGNSYVQRLEDSYVAEQDLSHMRSLVQPEHGTQFTKEEFIDYFGGAYDSSYGESYEPYIEANSIWDLMNMMLDGETIPTEEGTYIQLEENIYHEIITFFYVVEGDAIYFELYEDTVNVLEPEEDPTNNLSIVGYLYLEDDIVHYEAQLYEYNRLTTIHVTEDGDAVLQSSTDDGDQSRYVYRSHEQNEFVHQWGVLDETNYTVYLAEENVYVEVRFKGDAKDYEQYTYLDGTEPIFELIANRNQSFRYHYNIAYLNGYDEVIVQDVTPYQNLGYQYYYRFYQNHTQLFVPTDLKYELEDYVYVDYQTPNDNFIKRDFELQFSDFSFDYIAYEDVVSLREQVTKNYMQYHVDHTASYDLLADVIIEVNENRFLEEE